MNITIWWWNENHIVRLAWNGAKCYMVKCKIIDNESDQWPHSWMLNVDTVQLYCEPFGLCILPGIRSTAISAFEWLCEHAYIYIIALVILIGKWLGFGVLQFALKCTITIALNINTCFFFVYFLYIDAALIITDNTYKQRKSYDHRSIQLNVYLQDEFYIEYWLIKMLAICKSVDSTMIHAIRKLFSDITSTEVHLL